MYEYYTPVNNNQVAKNYSNDSAYILSPVAQYNAYMESYKMVSNLITKLAKLFIR